MGYQEIADLDCDVTIQLGGINKKTGKKNPERIEGYFIGSKVVDNAKSKTGNSKLHIFQTQKGNVGVWGKTNLDFKLGQAKPGLMTLVTFSGMKETKNNPMYTYKVQQDKTNFIEVAAPSDTENTGADEAPDQEQDYTQFQDTDGGDEEGDTGDDETLADEIPPPRAQPPARKAQAPSPERQAAVNRLLGNRGKASA